MANHQLVQRIGARAVQAAGVEKLERSAAPGDASRECVTRRPGDGGNDRAPAAGHPIEKRGLTDVRAPDEHYRWGFSHSGRVRLQRTFI
jgi:hypothetical protein